MRLAPLVAALFVAPPQSAAKTSPPRTRGKTRGPTHTKSKTRKKSSAVKTTKKHKTNRIGTRRWFKRRLPSKHLAVAHKRVPKLARGRIALARARKPMRLAATKRGKGVSFAPCASAPAEAAPQGKEGAVFHNSYQWPVGATLRIGFVDGSLEARKAVAKTASEWTEHANLDFDFDYSNNPSNVDILIRFNDPNCTSALGDTSRYMSEFGQPSMNLCYADTFMETEDFPRIVLHEFGHALGLYHEHQSPKANHSWNKQAVYDYYTRFGWDRDYVDQWVFRTIDPALVDATDYDVDSIMHYAFPPEFTTDNVGFGGKSQLSAMDKSFIAEVYPGKKKAKPKRRHRRKLAVRNDTGVPLRVQGVLEVGKGKKRVWKPGPDASSASQVSVAPGAEVGLGGPGRFAKVVATSKDGKQTWSEFAQSAVRISPRFGYLDSETQTYVVVIDGPPDAPKSEGKQALYDRASDALADGDWDGARELFETFADKYSGDPLAAWARLNVLVTLNEQKRYENVLDGAYTMIVDLPSAEPTPYAWYYGGMAALNLRWCEGVESYLGYAASTKSGLPKDWRDSAADYVDAVEGNPGKWCS